MKKLLSSWCGRLYLVVQCACLAVTIFLFVRFVIEDRELEMTEIQDTRMLYRISIQEGKGWTLPTRDEQPRLYESIEQTRSAHNQGRLMKLLYYLLSNITVPLLWGIGLFVAKGLPKQANPG